MLAFSGSCQAPPPPKNGISRSWFSKQRAHSRRKKGIHPDPILRAEATWPRRRCKATIRPRAGAERFDRHRAVHGRSSLFEAFEVQEKAKHASMDTTSHGKHRPKTPSPTQSDHTKDTLHRPLESRCHSTHTLAHHLRHRTGSPRAATGTGTGTEVRLMERGSDPVRRKSTRVTRVTRVTRTAERFSIFPFWAGPTIYAMKHE